MDLLAHDVKNMQHQLPQSSLDANDAALLREKMARELNAGGLPPVINDMLRSPRKLRIEEMVMEASGDSFFVEDFADKKKRYYEIEGSKTPDQHKFLKDKKGKMLLQMRQPEKEFIISDPEDKELLVLVPAENGTDVQGFVRLKNDNSTTTTPMLYITGNADATTFEIKNYKGTVIAGVSRAGKSMKKKLTGQDSYVADLFAGSPSLMVFIVVALDEIFSD